MKKKISPSLSWRALAKTHPSAFLLAAQLISLILYAIFDGSTNGRALLGAFGVLILTLVVWVIDRSPALDWIAFSPHPLEAPHELRTNALLVVVSALVSSGQRPQP